MSKQQEESFLSRWSRRKLEPTDQESASDKDDVQSLTPETESPHAPESNDAAEQENVPLPVWQQADIDPELKKQALRALFRQPEFGQRDGLNEYDDDFTQFTSLGSVVTHEMKRMIKLAAEQTEKTENTDIESTTTTTSQMTNEQREANEQHLEQEDDPLA